MTGTRVLLLGVPAVLASLVLAACGGSSAASPGVASIAGQTTTATGAAAPAASAADREATLMQASKCMRDNGIADFPDPVVDSSGNARPGQGLRNLDRNDPTVRKAFTACQKYFAAARPQFSPAQQQKLQDALVKYAGCMRTNGFDMPDPQFGTGGGGPGGGAFRDINRNDPTFKKANTACQSILAGVFPGGGRGGFGGGGGAPPAGGAAPTSGSQG
jgi:hypothetical protein